jgi:hypothetical protein
MGVLQSVLGCRTFATYRSGTPQVQHPVVARWHAHLHGLATAIHETSGLKSTSPLEFEYSIPASYINSRNQFPSSADKNPIDLVALRIDCTWDHAYLFASKLCNLRMLGGVNEPQNGSASLHILRNGVARPWRWACHWSTPRYRGVGSEAY